MTLDIGRVAIKIVGRESGKIAVVIDKINDSYIFVDGQVKRKRCNVKHLEPTDKLIKIKKNASHDEVVSELKKLNIEVKETKPKVKKQEVPKPSQEKPKETKKLVKEEKKKSKK